MLASSRICREQLIELAIGNDKRILTNNMVIQIVRANEHHVEELSNPWIEFMRYSHNVDPVFTPRDEAIPVFIKEYLHPAMEAENRLVLVALYKGNAVGYSYSLIHERSNLALFSYL